MAYLLNAAKLDTVCEDAGFVRTVSVCQFFMTRSELGLSMFGDSRVCRDNTHLRDHPDAHPSGSIDVKGTFGPSLDVLVTKRHDLYGKEIKILP